MINIKNTINFKALREKGPSCLDLQGDEAIQIVARSSEIKIVINQEYFLKLVSAYNGLLSKAGHTHDEEIGLEERLQGLESRFEKISNLVQEDQRTESCQQDGQKVAGSRY